LQNREKIYTELNNTQANKIKKLTEFTQQQAQVILELDG
jgi:hypothetical protein